MESNWVSFFSFFNSLRKNLLFSSYSSLIPLIYYILILIYIKKFSIEETIFIFLFILCRTHNSFIIVVHMTFYKLINDKDFRLLFILSQSGFYHLVCII